jgi:putative transposase
LVGALKVARLDGHRSVIRRQPRDETIARLLYCGPSRLKTPLGCVSPMQFEQHWLNGEPEQASP